MARTTVFYMGVVYAYVSSFEESVGFIAKFLSVLIIAIERLALVSSDLGPCGIGETTFSCAPIRIS